MTTTYRLPTGERDLRLLLVGQVGSVFGGTLTATATSVIAVVVLGAGARDVSLIAAAGLLPGLLLGPVAGVLLDRVDRPRRMLVAADLLAAAAVAVCAVTGLLGHLTVPALAGLTAVLGLVGLVHEGLYFSHLTALGVTDLGRARGRLQSGELLSRSAAASFAGPVAAAVSASVLFLGSVVTHLLSALCLLWLKAPDRREASPAPRASVWTELKDGATALRSHPVLATFLVYVAISGLALSGIGALRALFLLGTAGMPVALYTVPAVVATLLGAAGALAAPRLIARGVTPRQLVVYALPAGALAGAVLPTAGGSTWWVVGAATTSVALPAFVGALANIGLVTIVAEDVGDRYFARVGALMATVATAAGLVGALAGGALGTAYGVRQGLVVLVALDVLAAAVLVVWSRRSGRRAPATASVPGPAPVGQTAAADQGADEAVEQADEQADEQAGDALVGAR